MQHSRAPTTICVHKGRRALLRLDRVGDVRLFRDCDSEPIGLFVDSATVS